MKINESWTVQEFASHFLKARIVWTDLPKFGITNFGDITSMLLFRHTPFQVELFIASQEKTSFPSHRHPHVDTVEFWLSGQGGLFINDVPVYTNEQMELWLAGDIKATPIHIAPGDWHNGYGITPYSFLSMQKWLDNTDPSSVGLDWEGETSSIEHAMMWQRYMSKVS